MNATISPEVSVEANTRSRELNALVLAPEILVMPGAYDGLARMTLSVRNFSGTWGSKQSRERAVALLP